MPALRIANVLLWVGVWVGTVIYFDARHHTALLIELTILPVLLGVAIDIALRGFAK